MKCAAVLERKGTLFVDAMSKTTAGVWIREGPCLTESSSAPAETIGALVADALARSRTGVPHPTSWVGHADALLNAAGVKSWSTFAKKAKCVNFELDQRTKIIPTRNLGSRDGFVAIEDAAIELAANAPAEDIGQAVLKALALSA